MTATVPHDERAPLWVVHPDRYRLVHVPSGQVLDVGRASLTVPDLVRVLAKFVGEPWADARSVGELVLALDEIAGLGHLDTHGVRAQATVRRRLHARRNRERRTTA